MNRPLFSLIGILLLFLTSCRYPQPETSDRWNTLDNAGVDSVQFRYEHHFGVGYNFIATDTLICRETVSPAFGNNLLDSARTVFLSQTHLVVAAIAHADSDSLYWIQLADEKGRFGWTTEKDLLSRAIPDDPISTIIYYTKNLPSLVYILLLLLSSGILWTAHKRQWPLLHTNDLDSFYPTLVALSLTATIAFAASLHNYAPSLCAEYYFHPTLNPLQEGLPLAIRVLLILSWLTLIALLALIDDLHKRPLFHQAVLYLFTFFPALLVLTIATHTLVSIYIGYPLLLLYWGYALYRYQRYNRARYICGNCQKAIIHKGICPHCGVENH